MRSFRNIYFTIAGAFPAIFIKWRVAHRETVARPSSLCRGRPPRLTHGAFTGPSLPTGAISFGRHRLLSMMVCYHHDEAGARCSRWTRAAGNGVASLMAPPTRPNQRHDQEQEHIIGASCSDTSECNVRSLRLASLKPLLRALARQPGHRMRE